MNTINYTEIGATLFVPALHKDLKTIVIGRKYPELKSVLIDTEDAIAKDKLELAFEAIKDILSIYKKSSLLVFIRPRDISALLKILKFENIESIDGFILPKFSLENAQLYFDALQGKDFSLMPSIEGKELFNQNSLYKLRDIIVDNRKNIILIRFGLEDMLRQLKMKRDCDETLFDFSSTSYIIGAFIAIFKSEGFAVSGGVYPFFKNMQGFVKDVQRDLKEGLFSKTIIHPNQIKISNELYKVTKKEFEEALEICKSDKEIFNQDGKMAEVITMIPFSKEIVARANIYGIEDDY